MATVVTLTVAVDEDSVTPLVAVASSNVYPWDFNSGGSGPRQPDSLKTVKKGAVLGQFNSGGSGPRQPDSLKTVKKGAEVLGQLLFFAEQLKGLGL